MEEKVKEYVLEHYPKLFKDKPMIITENKICWFIASGEDKSPLILSKDITE